MTDLREKHTLDVTPMAVSQALGEMHLRIAELEVQSKELVSNENYQSQDIVGRARKEDLAKLEQRVMMLETALQIQRAVFEIHVTEARTPRPIVDATKRCNEAFYRADKVSELDAAYTERNRLVALLARIYPSGIRKTAIEGWDPCWHHCVFIDTPEGQLSWHYHDRDAELFAGLPPYTKEWDGHSSPEKYERLWQLTMRNAKSRDGYREGFKLGYDAGRAQGRKDIEHLRGKMP